VPTLPHRKESAWRRDGSCGDNPTVGRHPSLGLRGRTKDPPSNGRKGGKKKARESSGTQKANHGWGLFKKAVDITECRRRESPRLQEAKKTGRAKLPRKEPKRVSASRKKKTRLGSKWRTGKDRPVHLQHAKPKGTEGSSKGKDAGRGNRLKVPGANVSYLSSERDHGKLGVIRSSPKNGKRGGQGSYNRTIEREQGESPHPGKRTRTHVAIRSQARHSKRRAVREVSEGGERGHVQSSTGENTAPGGGGNRALSMHRYYWRGRGMDLRKGQDEAKVEEGVR